MLFKDEYEFLSNHYPSKILHRGTFWLTVEHAYQAAKCKDLELEEEIRKTSSPKEAKRIGKRVQLREDWEEIKVDIMTDLVLCKFTQYEDLRTRLLATGDQHLVETNFWHDNFWGDCVCRKCVDFLGKNILGIILMEIRDFWRGERDAREQSKYC